MNSILNLGKYLFAIPFLVFGVLHFMNADAMAGMAFGSSILVYLTGVALVAAAVSVFIGKMDKLATVLLGVYLILMVVLVHSKGMSGDEAQAAASMSNMLKDIALAGAAWMYASSMAKDDSVIG